MERGRGEEVGGREVGGCRLVCYFLFFVFCFFSFLVCFVGMRCGWVGCGGV